MNVQKCIGICNHFGSSSVLAPHAKFVRVTKGEVLAMSDNSSAHGTDFSSPDSIQMMQKKGLDEYVQNCVLQNPSNESSTSNSGHLTEREKSAEAKSLVGSRQQGSGVTEPEINEPVDFGNAQVEEGSTRVGVWSTAPVTPENWSPCTPPTPPPLPPPNYPPPPPTPKKKNRGVKRDLSRGGNPFWAAKRGLS